MIFSEIYGSYFNAVAKILERAVCGKLTEKDITDIVLDKTFGESIVNLPARIKSENWGLITKDLSTPNLYITHSNILPFCKILHFT